MKTFSALLAICVGNSLVPGEFPAQRPVTWGFHVFFNLRPNKRLSKRWWGWWFETPLRPLWRHYNALRIIVYIHGMDNADWEPAVSMYYIWLVMHLHITIISDAVLKICNDDLPCPRLVKIGSVFQTFAFSTLPNRPIRLSRFCLTQWISKLPGSFGINPPSKTVYLVNVVILFGINNFIDGRRSLNAVIPVQY